MRKLYVLMFSLFIGLVTNAQLSGTKNIPGDYADLAAAITDLNTQGVGVGGVILNLVAANPQTAPTGGYIIGGSGSLVLTTSSSANPVTIQGNGNTITANASLTPGNLDDGIFKLVGADWITISGFTIQENAGNTTTPAASNNMTEWGVALLYVTTTDGAQNNTIQTNTITLNRTYQNTFGVYSNSTHAASTPLTSVSATTATGGNSGLKIYGNIISNVNQGICVVGPTAAADFNNGVDIGGNGAGTGNTISNYGSTGTFSAYANVSASVFGILARNATAINISYNTITSSTGVTGVTAGAVRGIYVPTFSTTPTGTFTNNYNNNILAITSYVVSGTINGINIEVTTSNLTSTTNINNNNFTALNHTIAAASGSITALSHVGSGTAGPLTHSINNNTFTNITTSTTGGFIFIFNDWTRPANAVGAVNNNSIVTAFNKTGAGSTVTLYTSNGSSPATVSETNSGNNFSNMTVTGATTLNGWRNTDGGTLVKTVSNNTFTNWTGGTSALTGLAVSFSGSANVNGNVVSNISSAGSITGITSSSGNQSFFQNTVYSLTTTGAAAVTGMSLTGGTTQNVFSNKIYDLNGNNAGASVNGILISTAPTTSNVYNNLIGDLKTSIASGNDVIRGISVTATTTSTTVNLSFNTVFLNANSSGTNFGSSGIYHAASATATTAALTLRNNIVVNQSTPSGTGLTVAYRRSGTAVTNYASASNNNLFYAGTPSATSLIFYDGTNADQTLAAFKGRVMPREAASITESPNFVSTVGSSGSFLHINPAIATQIESGGVAIAGITTDFDGDVRNATPDIGADEFAGAPIDLNPPTIVYVPLFNACSPGARTLIATITDVSGVPTSGIGLPVLYYRINAGAYVSSQGTFLGSNQYQFSLGAGSVTDDVVSYYVVAQDNASTPNVGSSPSAGASGFTANPPAASTPPSTPNSYIVVTPMSGSFTIGIGGNYTTLTAAVADYNSRCLSGAVIFSLTDATYPGETFPITILNNSTASSVNTLTIKPAAGVTSTISGSNITAIFRMTGTDYVIIDGSNNNTTSRDLTINNTNGGTSSNLIWISNTSPTDSAGNNTIKNCILTGHSSITTFSAITQSGTVLGGVAEAQNNNNTYQNNLITRVFYGIAMVGSTSLETGNRVLSNSIGTSNVADTIGLNGIAVFQQQNAVISQNTIQGVITSSTSTASAIRVAGIANGIMISRNNIMRVRNTNTGGWGSNGIQLASSSISAGVTVVNNYVSDVASYGYSLGATVTDNGYGIIAVTGGGYNIYYNTVLLNTNQTVAGIPAALNIASTIITAGSIDLRNNHLVNTQTTTGARYAIYSAAPNTVFSNINYNNYFSTGSNLGYIGSDRVDLAAIQAGFGGNANSTAILPVFVTATDLRMNLSSNAALDNTGTPISGITTDFDNVGRSATTPDVGADEFTTGGTLPANLLNFSGVRKANANHLKWTVAQELDLESYEVERSENGRTWNKVGTVASLGNTTAQRTYNFTDNNIGGLKQLYRLRQLDRNGSQKLSNIVVITGEKAAILTMNGLFPNPALTQISLLIDAPAKDNLRIEVIDAAGRIVKAQKASVGEGSNTLQLNVSGLLQGSYLVRITSENTMQAVVNRFVKE